MQSNLLVGSMTQQSRERPRRARVWRLGMQPPGQPGPATVRAAATNPTQTSFRAEETEGQHREWRSKQAGPGERWGPMPGPVSTASMPE